MSFKEFRFGKMPTHWESKRIIDYTEIVTDYVANGSFASLKENVTYFEDPNYAVLIRLTDYNRGFDGQFVYIDEHAYNFLSKTQLFGGEIIISNVGANVGTVFKVPYLRKKMNLGPNSIMVKTKGNDDFYFYWFSSPNGQESIKSILSGSAQPKFNKTSFRNLELPIPPYKEQNAIAHILSTLDDKIEVNNEINKTLENMAQAIFKQWFVDFEFPNEDGEPYKSSGGEMVESELGMIPKGWEVGKLDDIATIVMGQSPKGTSYNEVGEGEVFYQGRTDFSSRFPIRRLFTTEPKRMANDGDVLMSVRAPVGDLNVANERCCIGRGLSAISSSADLSSYILYVMHDLRERLNVYNGEGTVFGSINQKDLKSIKVISSCDNKTEIAFDELIQPIDRMIRNNEDETRRLINLRDRLLPKLLSGEIRVPLDEEGDAS